MTGPAGIVDLPAVARYERGSPALRDPSEAMAAECRYDSPDEMRRECRGITDALGVMVRGSLAGLFDVMNGAALMGAADARPPFHIEIVGEDLHPLAQVRDFAPYIAKIKASGADTVITGNWGSDLALLIRSARASGKRAQAPVRPRQCSDRSLGHRSRGHLHLLRGKAPRKARLHVACSDQRVGRVEDVRVFRPQARQLGHVEETPVVDLLGCHPPVGEPVALGVE